jgi:hypothetical protein
MLLFLIGESILILPGKMRAEENSSPKREVTA